MADLARTPSQLGSLVRRTRKKLGLSQGELGERSGLRQATVSEIEAGHAGAKLDSILRILAALDLELRIGPRTKGTPTDIENIF